MISRMIGVALQKRWSDPVHLKGNGLEITSWSNSPHPSWNKEEKEKEKEMKGESLQIEQIFHRGKESLNTKIGL